MRFSVKTADIRGAMSGAERDIARSVTGAMRAAAAGLKDDLRQDVAGSGLGTRLANTWRGRAYPETGESVDAAAFVSSKAPKLIDAFDRGVTITAKAGKFLAIPAPDAGVRQVSRRRARGSTGHRLTPSDWEREIGVKLRFVPTRTGGLLVSDTRYQRQSAKMQRRKSFRPIRGSGPDASRSFVVIFVLVRQTRLRQRLDIDTIAKTWAERVPSLIAEQWI